MHRRYLRNFMTLLVIVLAFIVKAWLEPTVSRWLQKRRRV